MNARIWLLVLLLLPGLALAGPKKKRKKNQAPAKAAESADEAAARTPTAAEDAEAKKGARAVWDKMVELGNAHDPAVFGLYADTAIMKVTRIGVGGGERTQNFAVAIFLPLADSIMANGRLTNDLAEYKNVEINPYGDGWKVTGSLYSTVNCTTDPDYYAVLNKNEDGIWQITEEGQKSWAAIQCKADPDVAKRIIEAVKADYAGKMPMTLNDETRLDSLTSQELKLTYNQTLVNIPSGAEGLNDYVPELAVAVQKMTCSLATSKSIMHHGGSVEYVMSSNDGKRIWDANFIASDCK
ncbi:MAG: hypothetical protein KDA24_06540 [Deltaproteobacteria bacterium]|nr:hypothetical protein [Deltaproteobacteria bacterium]